MEQELCYQYCLSLAESYWAVPIGDMVDNQDINHISLDSYLLSVGISRLSANNKSRLRNRLDEYRSSLNRLRADHLKNRSIRTRPKAAIKIVGTAQIQILQLIISKISMAILPIAFSIWLTFLPQNMASINNDPKGKHFFPSDRSFYLSQGFINQTNMLIDENDAVDSNEPQLDFKLEAPVGVKAVLVN